MLLFLLKFIYASTQVIYFCSVCFKLINFVFHTFPFPVPGNSDSPYGYRNICFFFVTRIRPAALL